MSRIPFHQNKINSTFPPRQFVLSALFVAAAIWLLAGCSNSGHGVARPEFDSSNPLPSVVNSLGMKLILMPPGEFQMGSGSDESQRDEDEHQHAVEISRSFYLGETEVTQSQWQELMGTKPWSGKSNAKDTPNHAASYISYADAMEFCRKLSALAVEKTAGHVYRLPTEAEWEYACRAGTSSRHFHGDSDPRLNDYAWYFDNAYTKGEQYAAAVAQKKPNAFGLFDMHGNVWEWCQDWYSEDYYRNSPTQDPLGPQSGSDRVLRGGSWFVYAKDCRSASRYMDNPKDRNQDTGFRIVMVR